MPGILGSRVARREDPRLLQGLGTYVSDLKLPDMLHMHVVRSPIAHGRIVSIDTARASTARGVQAVFTGEDVLPDIKAPITTSASWVPEKRLPIYPRHAVHARQDLACD
jgi:carbon-monoxide dehydrogenase large subunit